METAQKGSRTVEQLGDRLRLIQEELDAIRGDQAAQGLATADHLGRLERQLQELSREAIAHEEGNGFQEIEALLHEARSWTRLAEELQLRDAVEAGSRLGQLLGERALDCWKELAAGLGEEPAADVCFRMLLELTSFELAILDHEGETTREQVLLDEVRGQLRDRLRRALGREPAGEGQREAWVTGLSDQASGLVADLAERPPGVASRQLGRVREDLGWHLEHVESGPDSRRRRLLRREGRVLAEWQERVLQDRLEGRFGRPLVALFEQLVFWLIFVILGLLVVEELVDLSPTALFWVIVADTAICAVFLTEFFVKLALVPQRWRWFRRHFLIDLLPAIPFGLLGLHAADPVRAGRLGRLLRLPRLARYLRVVRGLVRVGRIVGFMTRGLDRLARQYASLLEVNVILYPTLEERLRCAAQDGSLATRVGRLRARLSERWRHLLLVTPAPLQPEVAQARVRSLRQALDEGSPPWSARLPTGGEGRIREKPAEVLIRLLGRITPAEVSLQLGEEVTGRLARVIRLLARPPFRWLPLISAVVPAVSSRQDDADLVAEASHRLGRLLGRWHHRWFWLRDLYGTITPAQLVDRTGSLLVRSALRPAYRLTTFGIFFLITEVVLSLTPLEALVPVRRFLYGVLGLPIVVLGGLCMLVVAAGFWMQRVAQEATDFYEELAIAGFLQLTEVIRARYLERDARLFYRRVILPERRIHARDGTPGADAETGLLVEMTRSWLLGRHHATGEDAAFDPLERTVLLYRDSLDGALLADSDIRTTSQLLGNPALRRFRTWSRRFDHHAEKALQRLTLARQRTFLGGPYFWFLLITRAISHSTARLLMEYNRNALPRRDRDQATTGEKEQLETWLKAGKLDPRLPSMERAEDAYAHVVTTAFTALHFLDDDPQRDREVEQRFGPEVLARLRRDRGLLFRRIFGTYPMHRLPREERVLSLAALYEHWLGGGRILFLPFLLLLRGLGTVKQVLGWVWRCLGEIRRPEGRTGPEDAAAADFLTACRKVDRMRGPIVRASLRLRALADPEYLGVPLPGQDATTTPRADVEADCRFLDLDPALVEELKQQRARAEADMHRLGLLLQQGLLEQVAGRLGIGAAALATADVRRAAAVVYLADLLEVRPLLSCREILSEVFERAAAESPLPMRPWPLLRRRWQLWCYGRAHPFASRRARLAAWRAVAHNVDGAAEALDVWHRLGEGAREKGVGVLADLLRHPSRIDEMLVTLRAVQTLAVLDVLHYREHIYRLGGYAADGEPADTLLHWSSEE